MSNDKNPDSSQNAPQDSLTFKELTLSTPVIEALDSVGYEKPTPIQARTIPLLISGRDVLGQAQTGTGKTAAFALPILSEIDLKQKNPQALILAPTRELAIQVAEALQKYAKNLPGFHVLPVYGGQSYEGQLRALRRGVHVVVGTPGRVMDHLRNRKLILDDLKTLVLDEADEMLRMGFIDDVEWILEQTPEDRQIALFSATMPSQIRRIATKYLNNPEQVTVKNKTATASTIRQRFWPVRGFRKVEALTRILEAEPFDGMIIFVRTKIATVEVAEKLEARGYAATALSGDIQQAQRERIVTNLKKGKLDIIVATDVAARGLDVERISHVVNYDIPHDTESYVHRIGRTGRAGRTGDAILFVAPREKRMLASIERATKSKIEMMELPSTKMINETRVARLKQRISETLEKENLTFFKGLINDFKNENESEAIDIAAALAQLLQGEEPFLLDNRPTSRKSERSWDDAGGRDGGGRDGRRKDRGERNRDRGERGRGRGSNNTVRESPKEEGKERYRIAVGHNHQVRPGNIVGAIANEANLDSKHIGRIDIYDDFALVDLPDSMPAADIKNLKNVWVAGRQLNIAVYDKDAHYSDSSVKERGKNSPGRGSSKGRGRDFKKGDGDNRDRKSRDRKFGAKRLEDKDKARDKPKKRSSEGSDDDETPTRKRSDGKKTYAKKSDSRKSGPKKPKVKKTKDGKPKKAKKPKKPKKPKGPKGSASKKTSKHKARKPKK